MSKFDDELKMALRREEPSPDFTNRVMARIQLVGQTPARKPRAEVRKKMDWWQKLLVFFQPQPMKWAVAGALAILLFAVTFGVIRYREHQIELCHQAEIAAEAEGQRAKEQVMLAMRIASAKLNIAQKKVNETAQSDDSGQAGHQQN